MPNFLREFTTSNVTTGESALAIYAGVTKSYWLKSVKLRMVAATASVFSLCRPATAGTPSGSPFVFNSMFDVRTTSAAGAVASWTTSPTSPSSFFEKFVFGATIGAALESIYNSSVGPGGIFVPAGALLSFQNVGATGSVSITVTIWEE